MPQGIIQNLLQALAWVQIPFSLNECLNVDGKQDIPI